MPVSAIDPTTALVLVDLQRGITALAGPELIVPPATEAGRLAAAFRANRLPVMLVRTAFAPDGGDLLRNRVTRAPHMGAFPERPEEILEEVGAQPTDVVVTKRQPGAFYGTDLELQLRRRRVTGIVLGGLLTSYAVETTARDAYDRGFNITFASDAMADLDAANQAHCLESVFPRLGEVGSVSSILEMVGIAGAQGSEVGTITGV